MSSQKKQKKFFFEIFFFNFKTVLTCQRWEYVLVSEIRFFFFPNTSYKGSSKSAFFSFISLVNKLFNILFFFYLRSIKSFLI